MLHMAVNYLENAQLCANNMLVPGRYNIQHLRVLLKNTKSTTKADWGVIICASL